MLVARDLKPLQIQTEENVAIVNHSYNDSQTRLVVSNIPTGSINDI